MRSGAGYLQIFCTRWRRVAAVLPRCRVAGPHCGKQSDLILSSLSSTVSPLPPSLPPSSVTRNEKFCVKVVYWSRWPSLTGCRVHSANVLVSEQRARSSLIALFSCTLKGTPHTTHQGEKKDWRDTRRQFLIFPGWGAGSALLCSALVSAIFQENSFFKRFQS